MCFPVLEVSAELFPEMRPAMQDVWQDVGLSGFGFLDLPYGSCRGHEASQGGHPPALQYLLRRQPVGLRWGYQRVWVRSHRRCENKSVGGAGERVCASWERSLMASSRVVWVCHRNPSLIRITS